MPSAMAMAMPMKRKIGEYEELRRRNIEDNKIVLAKLLEDFKDLNPDQSHLVATKAKRKPTYTKRVWDSEPRRNPHRAARHAAPSGGVQARRGSLTSSIASSDSNSSSPVKINIGKLTVKFGTFSKRSRDELDDNDGCAVYDDDDDIKGSLSPPINRRRKHFDGGLRNPDDVTQAHLDLVAQSVSEKRYDPAEGTTCHQCRQKTDDQKTVCHAEECFGVRGQFCGPCLRNRYGEDAREALKNKEWICPPCRRVCNCSFCRRKAGHASTGILIHYARQHGYTSVYDYLKSFKS